MGDLLPAEPVAESAPQLVPPPAAPPAPNYMEQAAKEYSALPTVDVRPPDYDAIAAQNAAVEQQHNLQQASAIGNAPVDQLTYNPFFTSVLGNAPIAEDVSSADFASAKAGIERASRDYQKANLETLKATAATNAEQINAQRNATNIETAKLAEQAPAKAMLAVEAEKYEKEVTRINDQARFETGQQVQKVRAAADAAQQFEFKDFWASRNTAGVIMGIIAQALGGGLNAINGQAGAPTMLDKVIARDFEMQKAQLEQLNTNVANQRSILQEMRLATQDERATAQAFYQASVQKITAQIDAIAAKYGSQTAKANGELAVAALRENMAKKLQDYDRNTYDTRIAELTTKANIAEKQQALVNQMAAVHFRANAAKNNDRFSAPPGANVAGVDISNLKGTPALREKVISRLSQINHVLQVVEEYEKDPSFDPQVNAARIADIKNSIPAATGLSGAGLSEYTQKLEGTRIPGKFEVIAGKYYPGNRTRFDLLKADMKQYAKDIITSHNLRALPGSPWDESAQEASAAPTVKDARLTPQQMREMIPASYR